MRSQIIVVVVTFCFSCSPNNEKDGYVDLGEGFKLINEYPQVIIYSVSEESPASEKNVIPRAWRES